MKCKACANPLEEGNTRCPVCGFPAVMMVEGSEADRQLLQLLTERYRRKKLETASVALRVYMNEVVDNEIKTEESDVMLAQGETLCASGIQWYPEEFARTSGDPTLAIAVVNCRKEKKTLQLTVRNPEITDTWQIGVQPEDGFHCRILLGKKEKYEATELISLL